MSATVTQPGVQRVRSFRARASIQRRMEGSQADTMSTNQAFEEEDEEGGGASSSSSSPLLSTTTLAARRLSAARKCVRPRVRSAAVQVVPTILFMMTGLVAR